MKKLFIPFFALIILVTGCRAKREVTDIWNYIQEQPDSALAVLNKLEASGYRGRTLAEYRLLKALALDKNYIDVSSDSLARPAAEYFHRYGPTEKEMMSLYYQGVSYYYSQDYNKAIVLLDEAFEKAKETGNNRYMGLADMGKSYVYQSGRNVADAINAAKEGICYLSLVPDSTFQVRRAKLHLASSYNANYQFDNAVKLYEEILPVTPTDTFTQRKGLMGYAWSLYLQDNEQAATSVSLFKRAINDYHAHMTLSQLHHYGVVLLKAGMREEAGSILQYLKQSKREELYLDLQYRFFLADNKYKEAFDTMQSLLDYQNKVVMQTLDQSVIRSQRDYQEQAKALASMNAEHYKVRSWLLIAISLLILIAVFSIANSIWRQEKQKREQLLTDFIDVSRVLEETSQEKAGLEQELWQARQKYVSSYKKQFQTTAALVENYYATSGNKNGRDMVYRQVMDLATKVGNDRESMKALERNVNLALDNALTLYKDEFPGMGKDHYYLVCYFMAGFPAYLIELFTGIPQNTIYSKKRRLLEKIRNSTVEHRNLFLLTIE